MNMRRAVLLCIAAISMGVGLSGCGLREELNTLTQETEWTPDRTALEVDKEGTIKETIIDRLDQSYYSDSELKNMIDSSVSEYNTQAGTTAITIDSYAVENGNVTLVLTYRQAEDFSKYNNVYFFSGSMLGAQMEGYLFSGDFRKVTDGVTDGETISHDEPLSHKELQVLISDGTHEVRVPGEIVYVSANAQTVSEYVAVPLATGSSSQTAQADASSDAGTGDAEDTGSGNGSLSDPAVDQSLMYVLYEF